MLVGVLLGTGKTFHGPVFGRGSTYPNVLVGVGVVVLVGVLVLVGVGVGVGQTPPGKYVVIQVSQSPITL